jgi:hypothetical protein
VVSVFRDHSGLRMTGKPMTCSNRTGFVHRPDSSKMITAPVHSGMPEQNLIR